MQANMQATRIAKFNNKKIILQVFLFMLGVLVFVLAKTRYIFIFSDCALKEHLNLPCPVCGVTRSVVALSDFNFVESFKYHPTWFMVLAYAVFVDLVFITNMITGKKHLKVLYSTMTPFYFFLILLILQWLLRLVCIYNGIDFDFMYINV